MLLMEYSVLNDFLSYTSYNDSNLPHTVKLTLPRIKINSGLAERSLDALPYKWRPKIFHALIKNRNWTANKMFVNQHNRIC